MKILTVVGARPQFIKAAVVSHQLRISNEEILVHTGQHYDYNMSEQFFDELDIPKPNYNLGISGGSHAQMTANMMIALEKVIITEKPDILLVYGDTNSTLAAALTAAKLHVPVCHVEAGARTNCMTNPEEINRICTDHISSLLLASTKSGMQGLSKEGIADRGKLVGDPMYDAFLSYRNKANSIAPTLNLLNGEKSEVPREYYYLTCHREENTDDEKLNQIFMAMEEFGVKVVYPVHPRNKDRAIRLQRKNGYTNLLLSEPVGYLESIHLVDHAKKIVTDSGGLQREAFFAGKQCVTVLDFVSWPETMINNRNQLARAEKQDIINKLEAEQFIDLSYKPFGDGNASKKIVDSMDAFIMNGEY